MATSGAFFSFARFATSPRKRPQHARLQIMSQSEIRLACFVDFSDKFCRFGGGSLSERKDIPQVADFLLHIVAPMAMCQRPNWPTKCTTSSWI
jgi:hypothetical protein